LSSSRTVLGGSTIFSAAQGLITISVIAFLILPIKVHISEMNKLISGSLCWVGSSFIGLVSNDSLNIFLFTIFSVISVAEPHSSTSDFRSNETVTDVLFKDWAIGIIENAITDLFSLGCATSKIGSFKDGFACGVVDDEVVHSLNSGFALSAVGLLFDKVLEKQNWGYQIWGHLEFVFGHLSEILESVCKALEFLYNINVAGSQVKSVDGDDKADDKDELE